MNKDLIFDLQIASHDKHGEVDNEVFVKKIIEHVMAITRMGAYRNGPTSAENIAIKQIRDAISAYFDVEERDVNEIFIENELFREYFSLPKRGDRTYK